MSLELRPASLIPKGRAKVRLLHLELHPAASVLVFGVVKSGASWAPKYPSKFDGRSYPDMIDAQ